MDPNAFIYHYYFSKYTKAPMEYLTGFIQNTIQRTDNLLRKLPPHTIVTLTCVSIYAIMHLKTYCQPRYGETLRDYIGRILLKFSPIQSLYNADIQKERLKAQESVKKLWKIFEPLHTGLPELGWDHNALLEFLHKISDITSKALESKHLSGAIYSKNLDKETEKEIKRIAKWNDNEDVATKTAQLSEIFTEAFRLSHLWNPLHSEEFPIGTCIDYQVVNMVSSMFGGIVGAAKGFVTTGGTESLMLAMRIYRDLGMKQKGHGPGEGVIIACSSVHAAIEKACQSYLLKIVYIDCDTDGRADLNKLKQALKENRDKVIAIVGSAPSYPRGVVDPIEKMAKLAEHYGCPMHVDCCLGGFIVNNLTQHKTNYLALPGVKSLSVDTHKNGMAPKGSSVLITKEFNETDLASFSTYTVPNWSGGVYGTSKDSGSQSCVQSLCALVAMLNIGSKGYQQIAKMTHTATCELAKIIKNHAGRICLLAEPDVNVVAFGIDSQWGLPQNAIYALADEMYKNNVVLNKLHNDEVHFCVTLRFASNPESLERFEQVLSESLDRVKTLMEQGEVFSSVSMYGTINAALKPNSSELSSGKYIENLLFGSVGVKDAIRVHFEALRNPY